MAVTDWSVVPVENTAVGGIDIDEGCSPAGINDAIRAVMADVAAYAVARDAAVASGTTSALVGTRVYETQALLFADLGHAAGLFALVYADPAPENNDLYVKSGASGAGSWSSTGIFSGAAQAYIQPIYDDTVTERTAAEVAADDAAASLATVSAGVADVIAAKQEVLNVALVGRPSIGWIEPNDYPDINGDYRNDYGVKFYSDGFKVWPMMPDTSATLAGWRSGDVRRYHPTDAAWYVSVRMGNVYDPILSATPVVYYVNGSTGNDTTGDGSSGTPWKSISKTLTVINASGSSVFDVRYTTADYIGFGGGFDPGNFTIAAGKSVTITAQNVGGEKPWYLPAQRKALTKASFAWSDMGGGIWKSTVAVGTVTQAAKDTPIVFDLSVIDEDGAPTPSRWLAGPYADEAAILAAMAAEGPSFHTTGTTQYVRLASGDEPDPGVNFAYAELATGSTFLLGEGARLCIRNFRSIFNARTASGPTPWAFRPQTVTLGSTQPNPFPDIQVSLCDLEAYGLSGNAWQFHDVERAVVSNCRDAFIHLDGPTMSTFYTYPSNSNSPEEGLYLHMFVEDHVSRFHGLNGFRNQPTTNLSANGLTGHSRSFTTSINGRYEASNGSNAGFVTGAKAMLIACNFTDAKYVAPTTSIRQANYLAHGAATADSTDGTTIWAIYCTGAISPTGVQFHADGATAKIVAVDFRGVLTADIANGASLTDGYGNNL